MSILLDVADRAPQLVDAVERIPWLKTVINRAVINGSVETTAARPLPYALWSPVPIGAGQQWQPSTGYVTWTGLVDRRFTGRHLPPASDDYVKKLPPIDDVLALYQRKTFIPSPNTSALLCFFAQWFTDSFLRTNPNDRRLNTSNHEIDLCQIYGLDAPTARALRTLEGGRLRTSPDGLYPEKLFKEDDTAGDRFDQLPYMQRVDGTKTVEDIVLGSLTDVSSEELTARKRRLYATGLEQGNSTILYVAISTIFIREHNRLCGALQRAYPLWDDDRLFETARNTMIVMGLGLVVNEYINQLAQAPINVDLDRMFAEGQPWYRTNRISVEFDLLYRWHSMVPDELVINGRAVDQTQYRFNNALLEQLGPQAVIAAASRQPAGLVGLRNNPKFLWGPEKNAHVMARTHRLRSFTEYQVRFGTTAATSFEEISTDPDIVRALRDLYGKVERVEFLPGLFGQFHDGASILPSLVRRMVAVDAFSQIFTNPLLSRNIYGERAFSKVGLDTIADTHSFAEVVARNRDPGSTGDVVASFAYNDATAAAA